MRRLWLALVCSGCPSTPPPACLAAAPSTTCDTLYIPTFDNVWTMTLYPHCGGKDGACHHGSSPQAGLSFETEQTAYDDLMMNSSLDPKRARVVPGDVQCSLVLVRADSPGTDYQMPPGTPLPAEERCALTQWVANGAPGPGSGSAR